MFCRFGVMLDLFLFFQFVQSLSFFGSFHITGMDLLEDFSLFVEMDLGFADFLVQSPDIQIACENVMGIEFRGVESFSEGVEFFSLNCEFGAQGKRRRRRFGPGGFPTPAPYAFSMTKVFRTCIRIFS
jgi:hypothetical protein